MRTITILRRSIISLPLIAVLASCQKEDDAAPVIELTLRDELTFSIAPGQQGALDLTTTYDARTSVGRLLQEKGFSFDQLRDVRIEEARAVMMQPVNVPFDPFTNIDLHFTEANGSPFSFAHLDPVPSGQGILDLSVDHVDLTPYFQEDGLAVHARAGTMNSLSGDTARVRFALTFRVKAGQ